MWEDAFRSCFCTHLVCRQTKDVEPQSLVFLLSMWALLEVWAVYGLFRGQMFVIVVLFYFDCVFCLSSLNFTVTNR